MSSRTDVKSDAKANVATSEKQQHHRDVHSFSMGNFKPIQAPRRKAGLRDDQISITKHSIAVPITIANKLGEKLALLYSDTDRAIALQKSADGEFKLKSVGKNKSTKSVYAKSIIEAKKVKPGRYGTSWDEKNQMLIAKVS